MATIGLVNTLVGHGVQSGAGALAFNVASNQVHFTDFENIMSAPHKIGVTKVDGVRRKRFGNAGTRDTHVTLFDYPRGEPGVYHQSRRGPSGFGNLGGSAPIPTDHRHAKFNPALDLTETQSVAMGESVEVHGFFSRPAHFHYEDKTKFTIAEHLKEQADEFQDMKIRALLDKGFTPEEVEKKLMKERERAIEQAEKQPYNPTALMEAALAKTVPVRPHEEYPGGSVAPGARPIASNASSFDRSIGLNPNKAYARKAYQQINVERRLHGAIDKQEVPAHSAAVHHLEKQAPGEVIPKVVSQIAKEHEAMEAAHRIKHEKAAAKPEHHEDDVRRRALESMRRSEARALRKEEAREAARTAMYVHIPGDSEELAAVAARATGIKQGKGSEYSRFLAENPGATREQMKAFAANK